MSSHPSSSSPAASRFSSATPQAHRRSAGGGRPSAPSRDWWRMVTGRAHDGWTMVASPPLVSGPSPPLLALLATSIFVLVGCGVALLVRCLATTKPPEESRWWPAARPTGGQWWPLVDSGGGSVWTTVAAERPASAMEGGAQGGQDVMYQSRLLFVARGSKGHRRSSRLSM